MTMINLDFTEEEWFDSLCNLLSARYKLTESHSKLLTSMLCLGKPICVNDALQILNALNSCNDRSYADSALEGLRKKNLVRKTKTRPKMFKTIAYEQLWPEIDNTVSFLNDCKTIVEQNQETVNFEDETEEDSVSYFEKENEIVSHIQELCRDKYTMLVLRSRIRKDGKQLMLWEMLDKRLKQAFKENKISYKKSKLNAIIIYSKSKPVGLIRLRETLTQRGTIKFKGIKIVDAVLASILDKKED